MKSCGGFFTLTVAVHSDILLAASMGLADWFHSSQAIRFEPTEIRSGSRYIGKQTTLIEISTGVHGRRIQNYRIQMDVSL